MKKLFALSLIALFTLSCGLRAKKVAVEKELLLTDSIHVVDENLGKIVENTYRGTIPAADGPGIDVTLTFYHQEYASSGVYRIKETYLEGEDGKDVTLETTGTWEETHPFTDSDTVFVLKDYKDGSVRSYLYKGATIDLLDENMNPIVSENNYTLQRIIENEVVK